jgi:putative oxidoreductase
MQALESQRAGAIGTAVLRAVVGTVFVAHGAQKLFVYGLEGTGGAFAEMGIPLPALSAAVVTFVELLGGLALLVGFFTRWVALPLAFTMLVAMVTVHLPNGFFAPGGIEFTLVLLAASASLALTGPGALALDGLRRPALAPAAAAVAPERKARIAA